MPANLRNSDIAKIILKEDLENLVEDEEIIHLLLDKKLSENINHKHKESLSYGQKAADKLSDIAGSWGFIGVFTLVLIGWIVLNSAMLLKPYDPYPYILLNLILSCIAAIQAPIIMMSQNRREQKDRMRAENDYKVNLKSEIIIEALHIKLDHIMEKLQILDLDDGSGK